MYGKIWSGKKSVVHHGTNAWNKSFIWLCSSGQIYLCHGRIWWYILAEISRKVSLSVHGITLFISVFILHGSLFPILGITFLKTPRVGEFMCSEYGVWLQFNDSLYECSPICLDSISQRWHHCCPSWNNIHQQTCDGQIHRQLNNYLWPVFHYRMVKAAFA